MGRVEDVHTKRGREDDDVHNNGKIVSGTVVTGILETVDDDDNADVRDG